MAGKALLNALVSVLFISTTGCATIVNSARKATSPSQEVHCDDRAIIFTVETSGMHYMKNIEKLHRELFNEVVRKQIIDTNTRTRQFFDTHICRLYFEADGIGKADRYIFASEAKEYYKRYTDDHLAARPNPSEMLELLMKLREEYDMKLLTTGDSL